MRQFTLELYDNVQRPVVYLPDWHKFDAMLDTGALFPVWVDDVDHRLIVTVPDSQSFVRNLTIKDENGHLQVLCVSGDENMIDI